MKELMKVAFRQQALYLPISEKIIANAESKKDAFAFVTNIGPLGYTVSEDAFHALTEISKVYMEKLYDELCAVKSVKNNWTPLVKGWDKPTGESRIDP